ncbi:hypothetical protein [Bacteroides sp. 519]|uniref:hypothetical protein n=1 Tax=Bacteroides sp. 519 TaxID=2302937 RepID=UPI0013D71B10|nr:hypothetical protein [Bacteroides sp. 519]NDV58056.1 hypothetical protein [Bacteroides sp. 519]
MNETRKMMIAITIGILLMLLAMILSACKTTEYIPVETVRVEHIDKYHRDSIHVLDSIYIREKGDTVWLTRWRIEYKDRLIHDSIFICDTIQIPYPVERQLSKWEKTQMNMGAIGIGCMLAIAVGLVIWLVGWFKK